MSERPSAPYKGGPLLLDTHAFLWWLLDDPQLSRAAYRAIADRSTTVFVSAASAWEVTTKVRLGKLRDPLGLADAFCSAVAAQSFVELPISVEQGRRAGQLPGPHKDPFDRMLIAQTQTEGLSLVSNERLFDRYGVHRLW